MQRREGVSRPEPSTNGKWSDPLHSNDHVNFSPPSPDSQNYDDADEENNLEPTDRRFYYFFVNFVTLRLTDRPNDYINYMQSSTKAEASTVFCERVCGSGFR